MRGHGAGGMTMVTVIRPRRRVFPEASSQVGRARLFVGTSWTGARWPMTRSC